VWGNGTKTPWRLTRISCELLTVSFCRME
jgi:hypothetical protein